MTTFHLQGGQESSEVKSVPLSACKHKQNKDSQGLADHIHIWFLHNPQTPDEERALARLFDPVDGPVLRVPATSGESRSSSGAMDRRRRPSSDSIVSVYPHEPKGAPYIFTRQQSSAV